MSQAPAPIDVERERLYAIAKDLGLAWAAYRRRVYSVPPIPETDEDLPEPTDEEIDSMEIESETVALLQKLADVYELAARPKGDA